MNWYLEVLKKYAVFEGRARRSEYWYFVLINTIITILLGLLDSSMGLIFGTETIYSIALLIPSIAVGVRRMHDVGKSGWYLLIPIYNLILALTEGESGSNEYGSDPKNPDSELDILDHIVE